MRICRGCWVMNQIGVNKHLHYYSVTLLKKILWASISHCIILLFFFCIPAVKKNTASAAASACFKSLIGKKKRHTDTVALLVLIRIALIHPGWLVSGCPSLFLRVEGRSEADEWLSWPTADVGTAVSLWHGGVWCRGWMQWKQCQGGVTVLAPLFPIRPNSLES